MQKLILTIPLFLFLTMAQAQLVSFSAIVKTNYSVSSEIEHENIFFNDPDFFVIIPQQTEFSGKIGFEFGGNIHLRITEDLSLITGFTYEQIRFKTRRNLSDIFENGRPLALFEAGYDPNTIPSYNAATNHNLKTQLLFQFHIHKNILSLRAGWFLSKKVKTENFVADNPKLPIEILGSSIDTTSQTLPRLINSSPAGFGTRNWLAGIQIGIRYRFNERLNIHLDGSYSFLNFFNKSGKLNSTIIMPSIGCSMMFSDQ